MQFLCYAWLWQAGNSSSSNSNRSCSSYCCNCRCKDVFRTLRTTCSPAPRSTLSAVAPSTTSPPCSSPSGPSSPSCASPTTSSCTPPSDPSSSSPARSSPTYAPWSSSTWCVLLFSGKWRHLELTLIPKSDYHNRLLLRVYLRLRQ